MRRVFQLVALSACCDQVDCATTFQVNVRDSRGNPVSSCTVTVTDPTGAATAACTTSTAVFTEVGFTDPVHVTVMAADLSASENVSPVTITQHDFEGCAKCPVSYADVTVR